MITITYTRRLELRFPAIPDRMIRRSLKDHGFWWDKAAQCWHLARPVSVRFVRNEPIITNGFECALDFCATYLGLTPDQRAALVKQHDAACLQAAEQGMEAACGIA